MNIEQAIAELYSIRDFWLLPRNGDNGRGFEVREAVDMAVDALRAKKEEEKNEQPVCCDDCMYWEPTGALGGPSIGEIERLGKCRWIRGGIMASDFCSRGKRRPPVKEENREN